MMVSLLEQAASPGKNLSPPVTFQLLFIQDGELELVMKQKSPEKVILKPSLNFWLTNFVMYY